MTVNGSGLCAMMTPLTALPETVVVVFDGFDDLDAVAPVEILTAAGFPVRILGAPGARGRVRSAHGLDITVDSLEPDPPGLTVVPGGGWWQGTGVREQCRGSLPALLASWHAAGTVIGSVCTGAMLLATAGLLEGRPAVTNRHALEDLARAGADVRAEARVVDDGRIVTSGGPAAGIDFAVHLVARFAGARAGEQAAARLEHVPVGPVLVTPDPA